MEIIKTEIEGLLLVKPDVYYDERGYFFENYNEKRFKEAGLTDVFVQEKGMHKKLIADVNDAIDSKSNSLQGKLENYSKN